LTTAIIPNYSGQRGGIDFESIDAGYTTYSADGSISAAVVSVGGFIPYSSAAAYAVQGKVVTITGAGIVGFGNAGDPIIGKIQKIDWDYKCSVQDEGYANVPGISNCLPTPNQLVCCNGAGAVSAVVSANFAGKRTAVCISTDSTVNPPNVMILIA
jgi:hypothetical protein